MQKIAVVSVLSFSALIAALVLVPAQGESPSEGVSLVRLADGIAFRVERADVGELRVHVFDEGSGALLFDSGWRPGSEVAWRPAEEVTGRWRYRVEFRDARGALVLSQTAIREEEPRGVASKTSHGPSVMNVGSSSSSGEIRTFLEGSTSAITHLDSTSQGPS